MNSVETSQHLKGLQTMLAEAKGKLATTLEEQRQKQRDASDLQRRVAELEAKIQGLTVKREAVVISEHAMLQYLSRVLDIPLETIQAKMIPADTRELITTLGDGSYTVDNDGNPYNLIIKKGIVVTVTN